MKTFVQIVDGRVHWKFRSAQAPKLPAGVVLIDVTAVSPQPREGWLYEDEAFVAALDGFPMDDDMREIQEAMPENLPVITSS